MTVVLCSFCLRDLIAVPVVSLPTEAVMNVQLDC
jgi:hypothetical protein